jgi:hypothetical protein
VPSKSELPPLTVIFLLMTNWSAGDPLIIEDVILSGRIAKHDAKRQRKSGYLIRGRSKQKLKEFPLLTSAPMNYRRRQARSMTECPSPV